jgi:hypothetical protein
MAIPISTASSDLAGILDRMDDPRQGVLGLVIAVIEGAQDTLLVQAGKVMDCGRLDEGQCRRLGRSLLEVENALEDIKREPGAAASVRMVRNGPDGLVDDMVERLAGTL